MTAFTFTQVAYIQTVQQQFQTKKKNAASTQITPYESTIKISIKHLNINGKIKRYLWS